ncbi:MAG: helix-turn-helix transcriptional regulator [Spongiibacteraceae bacterium]|nr:helix-turn-helix transcriptional regulator [Spongiibacteraceae bacterium]
MAFQQVHWLTMSFPDRLFTLRKSKKLTQQVLANQVGIHVVQVRRYEAGDAQPTLEVIRKLAIALSVSADALVFDKDERGPGDDFQMQFEAINRFTDEEKQVAKQLLDSLILQHTANQLAANK